jgi:hypothetical protein
MLFHYCGSFSMLPRYCLGNLVGLDVLNCCHFMPKLFALVNIAFWKLSEWELLYSGMVCVRYPCVPRSCLVWVSLLSGNLAEMDMVVLWNGRKLSAW